MMTTYQQNRRRLHVVWLVNRIQYKDWNWSVNRSSDAVTIQIYFQADGSWQYCRRWIIEDTATDDDIYRTAFMAVLAAEEHEAREHFLVGGIAVFGPHGDVVGVAANSPCALCKKTDTMAQKSGICLNCFERLPR